MLQDKAEKQIRAIVDRQRFLADDLPRLTEKAQAMVVISYEPHDEDSEKFGLFVSTYGCTFVEILGLLELAKAEVMEGGSVGLGEEV